MEYGFDDTCLRPLVQTNMHLCPIIWWNVLQENRLSISAPWPPIAVRGEGSFILRILCTHLFI